MGRFCKSLGILLAVALLFLLGSCGGSSIKVNDITIDTVGVDTQMAVGEKQTLEADIDLEDNADLPDVTVTWSVGLQGAALEVSGVAKLTPSEDTKSVEIEALGKGDVEIIAEAGGKSSTALKISIVDDKDGDGKSGDDDPDDNDPCNPDRTASACDDKDGDGKSGSDDPDDNDPCNPDRTASTCEDKDGDGKSGSDDPDDNDPCNPDRTASTCEDKDGDGKSGSDDPDDNDPCNPDKQVGACDADGDGKINSEDDDDDNDGVKDSEDDDPVDPCKPDADAVACDTGDKDKDGTPNGQDDDPEDPCKPDVNAGPCDQDGDGLTNDQEKALGTDPTKKDSDGDGLEDKEEVDLGTDPNKKDSDGDGLEDKEEVDKFKTDPTKADSDGDGSDDGDEVNNGTDPNDPNDAATTFSFTNSTCANAPAVDDTCTADINIVGFSGDLKAFNFSLSVNDINTTSLGLAANNFEVTSVDTAGATSGDEWLAKFDKISGIVAGVSIETDKPAKIDGPTQIAKASFKRTGSGASEANMSNGTISTSSEDDAPIGGDVLALPAGNANASQPQFMLEGDCSSASEIGNACQATIKLIFNGLVQAINFTLASSGGFKVADVSKDGATNTDDWKFLGTTTVAAVNQGDATEITDSAIVSKVSLERINSNSGELSLTQGSVGLSGGSELGALGDDLGLPSGNTNNQSAFKFGNSTCDNAQNIDDTCTVDVSVSHNGNIQGFNFTLSVNNGNFEIDDVVKAGAASGASWLLSRKETVAAVSIGAPISASGEELVARVSVKRTGLFDATLNLANGTISDPDGNEESALGDSANL